MINTIKHDMSLNPSCRQDSSSQRKNSSTHGEILQTDKNKKVTSPIKYFFYFKQQIRRESDRSHAREHGRKSCPWWQQRAHLRHTHETPQVTQVYSGSGLGPRLVHGGRRGQRHRRSRLDSHFFMPV